jgi:hypothetical protein
LFQLVSDRYEHGSMILTSNKSYGDCGSIFQDNVIAAARFTSREPSSCRRQNRFPASRKGSATRRRKYPVAVVIAGGLRIYTVSRPLQRMPSSSNYLLFQPDAHSRNS